MAGPVSDSAPAFDAGAVAEDAYFAYGRFFFASVGDAATPTRLVDQHPGQVEALVAAVRAAGLGGATIALDESGVTSSFAAELRAALPDVRWQEASEWLIQVRAVKLAAEVELLRRAAALAEDGVLAAVAQLTAEATERELAATIAATMAAGGVEPRFVVVTSGPRSALADAYPTERVIRAGDLVRFDVGGTLNGYWADIGRTAVVGEPDQRQRAFYDAILAGEKREIAQARPGISGNELFEIAVAAVEEAGGPSPYRRQHCGHGIGLTTYEPVIIAPGATGELVPGMVLCLETPYYELDWGGMMVEDTIVITEGGAEMLTSRGRDLMVVDR